MELGHFLLQFTIFHNVPVCSSNSHDPTKASNEAQILRTGAPPLDTCTWALKRGVA